MFPIKINFNTYLEKSVFPPTNHAKVSYLVQAEETFLTGFFLRKTAGVVPHPKSWFYCHLACGRPFTISSHCQLHPVLNNKEQKKKDCFIEGTKNPWVPSLVSSSS